MSDDPIIQEENNDEDFLRDIQEMIDEKEREDLARHAAQPQVQEAQPLQTPDATMIYRPHNELDGALPEFSVTSELPPEPEFSEFPDWQEEAEEDVPAQAYAQEEPMQQEKEPFARGGVPSAPIRAYNSDYVKPKRTAYRAEEHTQRQPIPQPRPEEPRAGRKPVMPVRAAVQAPEAEELPQPRTEREKPKKRHGFLKFLLILLLILALLAAAFWFLYPKRPDGAAVKTGDVSTILIAGTDRDGTRTDTMMLLYINNDTGAVNLLSIPRDTIAYEDGSDMKLNAVYGYGGCGEKGMKLLMEEMKDIIGYVPDGYILVDFDGLAELIDTMGGIDFDVPCDMYYDDPTQDLHIDISEGQQTLNGEKAVEVLRFRSGYALADLQRVNVQRDMVSAAMDQWLSVKKLPRALVALAKMDGCTTTNLSKRNLAWIGKEIYRIGTSKIQSYTLPGEWNSPYYRLYTQQCADLINQYFNPTGTAIEAEALVG